MMTLKRLTGRLNLANKFTHVNKAAASVTAVDWQPGLALTVPKLLSGLYYEPITIVKQHT
jgi:hypothetical protein